jgi:hypothetical protein
LHFLSQRNTFYENKVYQVIILLTDILPLPKMKTEVQCVGLCTGKLKILLSKTLYPVCITNSQTFPQHRHEQSLAHKPDTACGHFLSGLHELLKFLTPQYP